MGNWDGDIAPASIEQVREGRNGKIHLITEDAGGVAAGLKQINPGLRLRYSEAGKYYVVYFHDPDTHVEEFVKTYQTCDARIVEDIARIRKENESPGYSYADELDKQEQDAEKERDEEDGREGFHRLASGMWRTALAEGPSFE